MFKTLLDKVINYLAGTDVQTALDEYISSNNPQDAADVDRLERGFYERHRRQQMWDTNK